MNRQDKIQLLKDIRAGKKTPAVLKEPTKADRLTNNELYLFVTINQVSRDREYTPAELECLEYYRAETNRRPLSREEVRGYPHASDADYPCLVAGSDAKVKEWYKKLNLEIMYPFHNCEPE